MQQSKKPKTKKPRTKYLFTINAIRETLLEVVQNMVFQAETLKRLLGMHQLLIDKGIVTDQEVIDATKKLDDAIAGKNGSEEDDAANSTIDSSSGEIQSPGTGIAES